MTYAHTTWYRLVDGTQADPNDVAPDAGGVLRHKKSGVAVAMRESGVPRTSATRDKAVEAAKAAPDAKAPPKPIDKPVAADREMKAGADGKKYETR